MVEGENNNPGFIDETKNLIKKDYKVESLIEFPGH